MTWINTMAAVQPIVTSQTAARTEPHESSVPRTGLLERLLSKVKSK
jgi:hypothetical protein